MNGSRLGAGRRYAWALAGLVTVGLLLRVGVMASWWPVSTEIVDSWPYSLYAAGNPFDSPQHPPGYSILLAGLGSVTRTVAVFVVVQQLMGIVSALVLFAAVRRLTGSPWVALAPPAVVLLGADQIYLEHAIMSESAFLLPVTVSLYATVRALDGEDGAVGWAALGGLALGLASVIRTAGLALLLVLLAALLLGRRGSSSIRPALATGGAMLAVLGIVSVVHLAAGGTYGLVPSPGWHLYSHAAQYADCERFEPPPGTAGLCEATAPERRMGTDHYLWALVSPGHRVFGVQPRKLPSDEHAAGMLRHADLRRNDDEIGAFARAAILAQPLDYARTVARDLLRYWIPGVRRNVPAVGADLSRSLDFDRVSPVAISATTERGMRSFFAPFDVVRRQPGIDLLARYQRVFRFGATLLTICTLLMLAGLVAGPRRARVGILLFGGGGLSLLVPPVVAGTYSGRYTVPAAGAIAAGAAIAAQALWQRRGTVGSRRLRTSRYTPEAGDFEAWT